MLVLYMSFLWMKKLRLRQVTSQRLHSKRNFQVRISKLLTSRLGLSLSFTKYILQITILRDTILNTFLRGSMTNKFEKFQFSILAMSAC